MSIKIVMLARIYPLHSNLVLFKLKSEWADKNELVIFTFQSGSIQIKMNFVLTVPFTYFTFQSGSIQIKDFSKSGKNNITLHSNLVLFKCLDGELTDEGGRTLHSNLVLFKLDYCSSSGAVEPTLHSNLVLFK